MVGFLKNQALWKNYRLTQATSTAVQGYLYRDLGVGGVSGLPWVRQPEGQVSRKTMRKPTQMGHEDTG